MAELNPDRFLHWAGGQELTELSILLLSFLSSLPSTRPPPPVLRQGLAKLPSRS